MDLRPIVGERHSETIQLKFWRSRYRAVRCLGVSSRELVIEGETGKKRLSDGSRKLGMHQCGEWRRVMSGVGFTHEQDCQGETIYKNSIKINAAGSIVSIVQYLPSEAMFIRLEKQ